MPIYEYKCEDCNSEFELLIFSGEVAQCPHCGSQKLTKKISVVNFASSETENSSDTSQNSMSSSACSSCVSKNCASCK